MHTEESIVSLLNRNDTAVIRAIYAIQQRQTDDELNADTTKHANSVGWSRWDAPWMSDMIAKYERWGYLTPKQMAVTRNKVRRYRRQLLDIALSREAPTVQFVADTITEVSPECSEFDAYCAEREATGFGEFA